ncbi:hypothetical protein SAMN02910298_02318 [Pseudobutyrivibrio sp. YE44]|uniref:hypothetical protein n=1 Tax=Pseudobutyrivibrio sp. YE44 TaxID=1520802 RepID=UPI000891EFB3|nr:hypothetical protein [Pseudobutyrivibrio sp. YE44]SDB46400.1 hypothetical protein SAMN02910298_02318 [Pseudobutyrivibrio sp. YE44]
MKIKRFMPLIATAGMLIFNNIFAPVAYAAEVEEEQVEEDSIETVESEEVKDSGESIESDGTTDAEETVEDEIDIEEDENDIVEIEESLEIEDTRESKKNTENEVVRKESSHQIASGISIKVYDWQEYYIEIDGYKFAIEDEGDYVVSDSYEMYCEDRITFQDFFGDSFVDEDLEGKLLGYSSDISSIISELKSMGEMQSDTTLEIYVKDGILENYTLECNDKYDALTADLDEE